LQGINNIYANDESELKIKILYFETLKEIQIERKFKKMNKIT